MWPAVHRTETGLSTAPLLAPENGSNYGAGGRSDYRHHAPDVELIFNRGTRGTWTTWANR